MNNFTHHKTIPLLFSKKYHNNSLIPIQAIARYYSFNPNQSLLLAVFSFLKTTGAVDSGGNVVITVQWKFSGDKHNSLPQFGITECLIQYKCSINTPPPHVIKSG
ncbi:hypothetical protein [uncultured Prevotella sp.]|uniref:hypothetical protein n=1 Tax=uncultured Prevotella sp. TaxID=159272 RepID=UPI00261472F4|nr:hypothetical protein [uncultured Prevotella sp.]